MAVDVFRNGMDHNVGAVVQGVLDIGAHEGVVHDHRDAMAVGNSRHLCDIHHPQSRVGRGLDPDQLGVIWPDQFFHVELDAGRERHMHAVGRCNLGEVPVCSAVDIGYRNHMRALCEGLEDGSGGRGAGGEGQGMFRLLEGSDSLFKVLSAASQPTFARRKDPKWLTGLGWSCGCIRRSRWVSQRWSGRRWLRGRSETVSSAALQDRKDSTHGRNNGTGGRIVRRTSMDR